MRITVGDLQAQLAKLDTTAEVLIAVNGNLAPAVGVSAATGSSLIVIRGRGKLPKSARAGYSVGEEVVIGNLVPLGASDAEIGEVLGRPADSVKRKRKALGFA